MVLHGARRSPKHQKLQKLAVVNLTQIQYAATSSAYRYTLAERCDGAVVTDAFLDAVDL